MDREIDEDHYSDDDNIIDDDDDNYISSTAAHHSNIYSSGVGDYQQHHHYTYAHHHNSHHHHQQDDHDLVIDEDEEDLKNLQRVLEDEEDDTIGNEGGVITNPIHNHMVDDDDEEDDNDEVEGKGVKLITSNTIATTTTTSTHPHINQFNLDTTISTIPTSSTSTTSTTSSITTINNNNNNNNNNGLSNIPSLGISFLESIESLESNNTMDKEEAIKALQLNQEYQKHLRSYLKNIEASIQLNQQLLAKAKNNLSISINPRQTIAESSAIKRSGVPYFQDSKGESPPDNADTQFIKTQYNNMPTYFKTKRWTKNELSTLSKGVREKNMQILLFRLSQRTHSKEEYDREKRKIEGLTLTDLEENLDGLEWESIVHEYLPGRTPMECELRWRNAEHPLINKQPFTKEEDKKLLELSKKYGNHSWSDVALELGTNRPALHCCQRHQRSLNTKFMKREWTKEEDEILLSEYYKYRNFGDRSWQHIAEALEGRTGQQCLHRWQKTLDPAIRKGRWTAEEDELLRKAVESYGKGNWILIKNHVPGRTDMQCRERWCNVVDPSLVKDIWTDEEDQRLKELTAKYGVGKWAVIAKELGRRTDNQCWRRWKQINSKTPFLQEYREVLNKKKEIIVSNFVGREKERPAFDITDFISEEKLKEMSNSDHLMQLSRQQTPKSKGLIVKKTPKKRKSSTTKKNNDDSDQENELEDTEGNQVEEEWTEEQIKSLPTIQPPTMESLIERLMNQSKQLEQELQNQVNNNNQNNAINNNNNNNNNNNSSRRKKQTNGEEGDEEDEDDETDSDQDNTISTTRPRKSQKTNHGESQNVNSGITTSTTSTTTSTSTTTRTTTRTPRTPKTPKTPKSPKPPKPPKEPKPPKDPKPPKTPKSLKVPKTPTMTCRKRKSKDQDIPQLPDLLQVLPLSEKPNNVQQQITTSPQNAVVVDTSNPAINQHPDSYQMVSRTEN